MKKYLFIIIVPLLFSSCNKINNKEELKTLAEKYFHGIYGCNPSVVDDLAADSIIISYPVFEKIFGSPVIRGKDSVKNFVNHFCGKWKNAQITFHKTIAEGNNVLTVWSFKALDASSNQEQSWGGITFLRFNNQNQVIQEIGEESTPGPIGRLSKKKD